MNKVVFISDFFLEEVRGGAEFCNDALISLLGGDIEILKIKSQQVDLNFVSSNQDSFFVVANFFMLSENIKSALKDTTYVILEHDHKYVKSNNPSLYRNFLAPESQIQNKDFYRNALAVLCQSKKHASVVQRNLLLNNIVSLGGNIWTEEQLSVLENNMDNKKTIEHAVMYSNNRNKGMPAAVSFCKAKNLEFEFIKEQPFPEFIENLSRVKKLVFFPQWLETFNRLSIELKILGGKLITNTLIGAASEEYFKLSGRQMLDFIRDNNQNLKQRWLKLINNQEIDYISPIQYPKITIFCPLYSGEKYIEKFLEDMQQQTIFEECELIIIDANSPENEKEYIETFCKENSNTIYRRLDYRASVMETENMAIEMASGEYFAQTCVDDRHHPEYLEIMRKTLYFRDDIDLVYADCLQTTKPNETFHSNSANGAVYEHSINEFSKENMIKCLPGPMPMWKLKIHEQAGMFNDNLRYAGDWDMFLRMVDNGAKFKKVDKPLGLYYYNSEGLSTSTEYSVPRGKEEATVFFEYKNVFGEQNFNKYKDYFSQFLRN
jgi:glycosyltransferase involved in cell wall biosynthesis